MSIPFLYRRSMLAMTETFAGLDRETADNVNETLGDYIDSWPLRFIVHYLGFTAIMMDIAFVLVAGLPLRFLSTVRRERVLNRLTKIPVVSQVLWLWGIPYKLAFLVHPETRKKTDTPYGVTNPGNPEPARWRSQIVDARDCDEDIEIEADVAVIGSGAGGAAAAYELASRGHAVVIIEAGRYYDRSQFDGKFMNAARHIYRPHMALGNGVITVLAGQSVGGTTTINSGTCFRTPDHVLESWRRDGLSDLTPDALEAHFRSVEAMLGIQEAGVKETGPLFDAVFKGASALGFHEIHRLPRNAPDCDGQGICQIGCPTDAKRSTNVSYVPAALKAGAVLYASFEAGSLQKNGKQITGVTATGKSRHGKPVRLRVKAPHVVVAMGTILTPVYLKQQGVKNPNLGRNLSIHTCGGVAAELPGWNFRNEHSIPQAVGVGDWSNRGIRFEGGTPPLALYGLSMNVNGTAWRAKAEGFQHTAFFGFMLKDTSRGRVRKGLHRRYPLVTYRMNEADLTKYVEAMAMAARMFFRAGAERVNMLGCGKMPVVTNEKEVNDFERRRWRARDFAISAYHPLGTARIGASPTQGVCGPDHQVYGFEGLYVMDGSSVPSSLGVNPQVTIMTLATRAAIKLADKIDGGISVTV